MPRVLGKAVVHGHIPEPKPTKTVVVRVFDSTGEPTVEITERPLSEASAMLAGMDLVTVLRTVTDRLQVEFEGTTDVQHNASKGRLREAIVMAEVITRMLPETMGVVQGAEIVCSAGTVSAECDLVVYDRNIPPIYKSSTYQVFPIEAVLAVIEVKSHLNKKHLTEAVTNLHQIRCMERTALFPSDGRKVFRYDRWWSLPPVRAYVVAFDSIRLGTIASYLQEAEQGWLRWECLDAIFIPGKGYLLDASTLGNKRHQVASISHGDVLISLVIELLMNLPRPITGAFNPLPYLHGALGIAERSFGEWNQDGTQA